MPRATKKSKTTTAPLGLEAKLWAAADAPRRWPIIAAQARQSTIGQLVDDAMAGIERQRQLVHAMRKVGTGHDRGTQPHKGLHDQHADLDRARRFQNIRKHQTAVLGESKGKAVESPPSLGCSCILQEHHIPHLKREPEHELRREAIGIAVHLLIQLRGSYAIEFREVDIKHDSLVVNHVDEFRDSGNTGLRRHGVPAQMMLSHFVTTSTQPVARQITRIQ